MISVGDFLAKLFVLATDVSSFVFTDDFLFAAASLLTAGFILKIVLTFA